MSKFTELLLLIFLLKDADPIFAFAVFSRSTLERSAGKSLAI